MKRRDFLKIGAVGSAQFFAGGSARAVEVDRSRGQTTSFRIKPFEWQEATCAQLQAALASGRETANSLTKKYLRRIEELDQVGPALRSVLETNPDALAIARSLDRERKSKGPRGPLHGIPILLKDNIATHDRMMTTAGSLALAGCRPPRDSFVARKLREAGAVLIGKANLTEWANFRSERASSGWSGRGGQTRNPYVLDRNPSGSSSGSAVAVSAGLCPLAIGTETDGSIVSPSAVCGIVGIKPTVGLVSRAGIIPISSSQDTAGPMARTVTDAAVLLGALAGPDPRDNATESCRGKLERDYARFLDPNGLRGARLGVARRFFPSGSPAAKVLETALDAMKSQGAILVEVAQETRLHPADDSEWKIMQYEFKAGIHAYLADLGPDSPMRTLEDLIDFNERNREREMPFFGQETFVHCQAKGPLSDPAYLDALANCRRASRQEGIDAVMDKLELEALVAPSGGPAGVTDLLYGDRDVGGSSTPAAVAGYPNISVPAGLVQGLPVGMSFFGRAYREPALLKLAFAFEQTLNARTPPGFRPTLG